MKPAARRRFGTLTGMLAGSAVVVVLGAPGFEQLHAPGPMNTGHDRVACEACHRPAPGSLRQQLQTAARNALGLTATASDIGFRPVTNAACLSCHDRPDDRHPVFRFLEPRFAKARAELHPELCTSCHAEHDGVRVTRAETTFCRTCHADLQVEHDPIDVPHRELVASGRWETCLGCHDFHGNHARVVPRRLADAIPVEQIRAYFEGGASPYGDPVRRARTPEVKRP